MKNISKNIGKCAVAIALGVAAHSASAAPVTFFGADAGAATTNSDSAFANWEAAVGSYTLDNLDGISGGGFGGGTVTTTAGNSFTSSDDAIFGRNFSFAVLQGDSMRLNQQGGLTNFVWNMVDASDSFGFFSRGNEGGLVNVSFNDGTEQMFEFTAESTLSNGDNFFWGIVGLDNAITSVSITSTDPGTQAQSPNSDWDRFVYRPSAITNVNAPTGAVFTLLGLALITLRKRSS